MSFRIITLFFVGLWSAASYAQSQVEYIVHQKYSGELDANGWVRASSVLSKFSIEMPCNFVEYTSKSEKSEPGIHFLGCQRADDVRFAVIRGSDEQGVQRSNFDSFADDKRFQSFTFKGQPAYQYTTMAEGKCAKAMIVWSGRETLSLVAERISGTANCLGILVDGQKFVQSLEIEQQ